MHIYIYIYIYIFFFLRSTLRVTFSVQCHCFFQYSFQIIFFPKNTFIEPQITYHIIHSFKVYYSMFFLVFSQNCAAITKINVFLNFYWHVFAVHCCSLSAMQQSESYVCIWYIYSFWISFPLRYHHTTPSSLCYIQ